MKKQVSIWVNSKNGGKPVKRCQDYKKKVEDLLQRTQEIALYFKTKPEHFCRYIRLLFDGGRSVLSGILNKELSLTGLDLTVILLEQQSQLETKFINEEMRNQVFPHPANPNTDYDSWDILTLTTVTLHAFSNLSEDVVGEIKVIDVALRNYAPTAFESVNSTKFQFCCEDLVSSLKALSNYVGGETKANCKMLIEAYRKTDDANVDVDNYLNQMALYALEIKTIPCIYNKTIADLKECACQMMEEGIVFEREKDMDLKMVVIGRTKEKENLAEEILDTVWRSALQMSASPEEFLSVRLEVDKILEEVRKIPSVKTTKVERHCIILTLRYSSWEALLEILKYTESRDLCEHFENISRELGYILGETVVLKGNVTVESIHSATVKLDKHTPRKDSGLKVVFACSSVESMGNLFSALKGDETKRLFSNINNALSKYVGDRIVVRASPEVIGLKELFDIQEKTAYQSAIRLQPSDVEGLQPSEIENLEQKGRFIVRNFDDLYDSIACAVTHKAFVTTEDLDPATQKAEADKVVSLFVPDYIHTQVVRLLNAYSEQFVSMLPLLEILSSVAIPFKDESYSEENFKLVLTDDRHPSLCLKLFAIATCVNIRIFVLCRNCHGNLQWFLFSPLFEFENQPNIAVSYISLYLPSNDEFFVVASKKNTPEPKAYGLIGLYLTALDDIPIDRIDVPNSLLSIHCTPEELCNTMNQNTMEECWKEFRRHGFKIADVVPERRQFFTLVKDSKVALTIVCKVLAKNKRFTKLYFLSVKGCRYLECHRKVSEIDQATVEINAEVSKLVNECKELISKRKEKTIRTNLAKPLPLSRGLIPVGIGIGIGIGVALAPFTAGTSLALVVPLAASAYIADSLDLKGKSIEKRIEKMMILLKAKEKGLLYKQMEINLFLEIASSNGVLDKTVVRKSSYIDVATKPKSTAEHGRPFVVETLPKAKHFLEGIEDAMKKMICKQRVISNIFRGSFDDSERMVTLENTGVKVEV